MIDPYEILHDTSIDIFSKIDMQVDVFWNWSKAQKQEYEWEANYPNWSLLTTLFTQIIDSTDFSTWSQRTINNLLYLIARDNECEILIDKLTEHSKAYVFLALEGLRFPDSDARWQLAHYLIKIVNNEPNAEDIILKYVGDHVEYVSRRAMLALGYIKSKYAEDFALKAWKTNLEYQKIAALEVLHQLDSKHLEQTLKEALNNDSEIVRQNAERIIQEHRKLFEGEGNFT